MSARRPLVERWGARAEVAWGAIAVLVASAGWLLTLGEPDWAVFVAIVVGVALVPPVRERDPTETMPGELLALLSVPVILRVFGLFKTASPFFFMAGLALLVAIVFDSYTSLELAPRFVVVFVVITTMAFAAVWTVGTFTADVLFGTNFVGGETELMWDLVTATCAGVFAGVVFALYFRFSNPVESVGEDEPSRDEASKDGSDADDEAVRAASRVDLPGSDRSHRLAVRGMQLMLLAIAAYGLVRLKLGLFLIGAITLAITLIPALLRREYDYRMNTGLTLWITLAVTLHVLGALGLYGNFPWYDSVAHTVSATFIAGIGYALARTAELHTDAVSFRSGFRGVFVVLIVLAAGIAWEILEFASGGLATILGGQPVLTQYGVDDIASDLVFDAAGAVLVAVASTDRFEELVHTLRSRVDTLVRSG